MRNTVKTIWAVGILAIMISAAAFGMYELYNFRLLDLSFLGGFGVFFNGIFFMYILSIAAVIFLENKDPSKTLAWIMVLFMIPILGFIIYLIIGGKYSYRIRSKFKRKRKESRITKAAHVQKEASSHAGLFSKKGRYMNDRLLNLLLNNSDSPFTLNNSVDVLTNGDQTFESIIGALENAKDHIHLEYFIIRDDEIGNKVKDVLIRKAESGVDVKVIYDSVGCWSLSKRYIRELKLAGISVKEFFPVIAPILSHELNYRNHRKIIVIDGNVGFLGGLNIGDEYLGKSKRMGFWRDTHLRIEGEAVYSLQDVFINDWAYVTKSYGEFMDEQRFYPPIPEGVGKTIMQVTSSGPDSNWQSILQAYFTMISTAEDRIWITTPYLVPEESLMMAIKTAALSGKDVRIIMPDKMDHFLVYWASRDNIDELLKAGVRIYSYKNGFIHSKTILVDGLSASVGTANLDIRSLEINFEVNAFIYDKSIVQKLESDFLVDISNSVEHMMASRRMRPMSERLLEALGRLVSPLQ